MKQQISEEWHILHLVCRLHHTATKQSLKLCGWQHKGGIETLWIYYNILVQLCLLSQSFILCFKMSTVIFPLPFSSTSVVQLDYLNKSNAGHHGSTEAEPQLFPVEVKQDTAWLQHSSPPYQGAAGLLGSIFNRWGLPTHQYIPLPLASSCFHAKKIEGLLGALPRSCGFCPWDCFCQWKEAGKELQHYCLANRKPPEQKTYRSNCPPL